MSCKEYDEKPQLFCGDCAAFNGSRCRITYMYVERGYEACFHYMDYPEPKTSTQGERELLFKLIQELAWVEIGSKSQTSFASIEEMKSKLGEFYVKGIIAIEENGEETFIIWDQNNPNNLTLSLHTGYSF